VHLRRQFMLIRSVLMMLGRRCLDIVHCNLS
jgi:hypothetical protein